MITQASPRQPVMINAERQSYAIIAQATSGGASMEPNEAPMLYTPPASPRSFAGNHSAVAFMPAGFADPSVNPSAPRSQANACQPFASECDMLISDHAIAKM